MTQDDIVERIKAELAKNGGERRPACEKVAAWVGDNTNRLKAFWERFGTEAVVAIEREHQTDVRLGKNGDDEWEPPEGWGTDGRAERVEAREPGQRVIAFRGKRVTLDELTGEKLVEWGREQIAHGEAVIRTGKRYVSIGETAGERTIGEAWSDLSEEQQAFLADRTEPSLEVAS